MKKKRPTITHLTKEQRDDMKAEIRKVLVMEMGATQRTGNCFEVTKDGNTIQYMLLPYAVVKSFLRCRFNSKEHKKPIKKDWVGRKLPYFWEEYAVAFYPEITIRHSNVKPYRSPKISGFIRF